MNIFSTAGHDLYRVLDLDKSATQDDIANAYRNLAQEFSSNVDDPHTVELFKEIKYANAILSNPRKRQVYDSYGSMGIQMADTIGEDNLGALSLMENIWFKGICYCCALFTGCYCCCCCCCCCNFCCGMCKPETEEYEVEEMMSNCQNGETPIINQPDAIGIPIDSPPKYEDIFLTPASCSYSNPSTTTTM